MDRYSPRPVRPVQSEQPPVSEPVSEPSRPSEPTRASQRREKVSFKNSKNKPLFKIGVGVIGLLVVSGVIWWFAQRAGVPSYVERDKYQAVFLQNGEFYFGKIQYANQTDVKLTDVYYVQKATAEQTTEEQASNDLELVKLGAEVHGPQDMMLINRSQVLYIENLKSDSRVTQLINEQKSSN